MKNTRNPHLVYPCSIRSLWDSIWGNRYLVISLTRREISSRYKGSVFGLLWSLLTPLFMLLVYTFVFSVVFKARWGEGEEGRGQFAVVLFAGLIIHGLFAEVINRAPQLVLTNTNYVKKVVFPLEILPFVQLLVGMFNAVIGFIILFCANWVVGGSFHWTILYLPLLIIPLAFFILGGAWFLTSIGVYIRDVSQVVVLLTTIMLFLSPVFFPLKMLPERYQLWMNANPLTFIIEQVRGITLFGYPPDWMGVFYYWITSMVVMLLGFVWFQKTRKGFADVL